MLQKLPISFEANAGQTDPEVAFSARISGGRLFLTRTEAVLVVTEPQEREAPELPSQAPEEKRPPESAVVRIGFEGANPNPRIFGEEIQEGRSNYFIGNDPSKWHTNVPNYSKVRYEGLYEGIDAVFYSRDGVSSTTS